MIKILGIRKITIIGALAFLLVATYGYGVMFLGEKNKDIFNQIKVNESEFDITVQNLGKLKSDLEQFGAQKKAYEKLEAVGFFDSQDRLKLRSRINYMQKESGVISARYTIGPATSEENEQAAEAGYKVLESQLEFIVEAYDDQDIYKFLYLMNYGFPGHITISEAVISREVDVTPALIQKIGTGEVFTVISARFTANLKTMVVDPNAVKKDGTYDEGGIM